MLDKTQSELFLNRVESVLQEELQTSTDQQVAVLLDGLDGLLNRFQPEQITDLMIQGQWDVATHLHPVDGSLAY